LDPLYAALINAGVGGFIAVLILVGLYYIVRSLGSRFVDSQVRQAEALGAQAQALASLSTSVQRFTVRDNTEHREMLVLLRLIAQHQESLEEVKREHEHRKKSAHQNCPVRTT
jgi:hypothetical protein